MASSRLKKIFGLGLIACAVLGIIFINPPSPLPSLAQHKSHQQSINIFINPPSPPNLTPYTKLPVANVKFSFYDPTKGGINCDRECGHTASGEEILDPYNRPIGPWWWNGYSAGVACPPEYPFGTEFYVDFPDGEEVKLTCIDRGGSIVVQYENGTPITRLDILHFDDRRCGERYCQPVTTGGYKIDDSKIYQARVKLPNPTNTGIQPTPGNNQNGLGPTGRYCYSYYLARLGRNPIIDEGMCPLPGWETWCPYGQGRKDGMGQLVSIKAVPPRPGVNCYQK